MVEKPDPEIELLPPLFPLLSLKTLEPPPPTLTV
jgi:hypothetical protein